MNKRFILCALLSLILAGCQTTSTVDSKGHETSIDAALQRAVDKTVKNGQGAQSMVYLEKIYKRNSEDANAAVNYARALRHNNYLLRALTVLSPFADDADALSSVQNEYAAIQLAQGNYAVAERYARKARVKEADNPLANHYLGIALDAQGDHIEAEKAFRKALDVWEGDPTSVMNNLALNLASQNKLDDALSILQKGQSIAPHKVEIERNIRIVKALKESRVYPTQIPRPKLKPSE